MLKSKIQYLFDLINLIPKLGYWNVFYVIWYRFSISIGLRKLLFPTNKVNIQIKEIFNKSQKIDSYNNKWRSYHINKANHLLDGNVIYFFNEKKNIGYPPNWFKNPYTGEILKNNFHWLETKEFGLNTGDIKILWEVSRFYWLNDFAIAYKLTGEVHYLKAMNDWISDWIKENPYNQGINWRCGQEAAIRVINIFLSLITLGNECEYNPNVEQIILLHLKRIRANILYAIAQDNNHGVSEATALFLGGVWLEKYSRKHKKLGIKFKKIGIKWIENRVNKLIQEDGSFSQHSSNYHRVLVDLLTIVEIWNKKFQLKEFSQRFYKKAVLSIEWLEKLIDLESGELPNLGANDGALILKLNSCNYSDYRPTIQLARLVFCDFKRFEFGPWDESSILLGLKNSKRIIPFIKKSEILDKSYGILRGDSQTWAMLRLPKFRFRPKHNDVNHFDLWFRGKNILLDSGSFSYFDEEGEKFKSVSAHNTLSFGGKNQMPRFSKFLLKNWLNSENYCLNENEIESSYFDSYQNFHDRKVSYQENIWTIKDSFKHTNEHIEIYWNFKEPIEDYSKENNSIHTPSFTMKFEGIYSFYFESAKISKYYNSTLPSTRVKILTKNSQPVITRIYLKKNED